MSSAGNTDRSITVDVQESELSLSRIKLTIFSEDDPGKGLPSMAVTLRMGSNYV